MGNFVLGYEKVGKYQHILDVLVREVDGEFKVVLPRVPKKLPTRSELNFIDVWYFRDATREDGKATPVKINSDGREYLVLKLDVIRENAIYRLIPYDVTGREYIARVLVTEVVRSVKRDTEVQEVFYNEEGDLDLQLNYVEEIKREVSILGVTDVEDMRESKNIKTMMERDLDKGLINELIKEAGDSEIALAVIKGEEVLNVKNNK